MTFSITEQPPAKHETKAVAVLIDFKYGFEIRIWKSGCINVWRTVNGRAAGLQRMSRPFWKFDDLIANYKKLRPVAEDLRAALYPKEYLEGTAT